MPADASAGRNVADRELLDSLCGRDLMIFRRYMHTQAYIRANAAKFVDDGWVDMSELRDFLNEQKAVKPMLLARSPAKHGPMRPVDDIEFLDNMAGRVIIRFRKHIFSLAYIRAHESAFQDNDWVSVPELRDFVRQHGDPHEASRVEIKREPVKLEPIGDHDVLPSATVRTRTLQEHGHEVVEIISSDSEPEDGSDIEVVDFLTRAASRSSSIYAPESENGNASDYYWVACDGWTKQFKENHRTFSVPDFVDEGLLLKLFAGDPMANDDSKDTPPCTCIVHPRTGLKQTYCHHPHIVEGHAKTRSRIIRYPCNASRTIWVPLDPSIRRALVFHKPDKPHTHPMPPLTKMSVDLKHTYTGCIEDAGTLGALY